MSGQEIERRRVEAARVYVDHWPANQQAFYCFGQHVVITHLRTPRGWTSHFCFKRTAEELRGRAFESLLRMAKAMAIAQYRRRRDAH